MFVGDMLRNLLLINIIKILLLLYIILILFYTLRVKCYASIFLLISFILIFLLYIVLFKLLKYFWGVFILILFCFFLKNLWHINLGQFLLILVLFNWILLILLGSFWISCYTSYLIMFFLCLGLNYASFIKLFFIPILKIF